jgi:hypothetical protein
MILDVLLTGKPACTATEHGSNSVTVPFQKEWLTDWGGHWLFDE